MKKPSSRLEKILLSRTENWVLGLVVLAMVLGGMGLAYLAQERARGSDVGGWLGRFAENFAGYPGRLHEVFSSLAGSPSASIDPNSAVNRTELNSFGGLSAVPGYLGYRIDDPDGKMFRLHRISDGAQINQWRYTTGNIPAAVSMVDNTLVVKENRGFEEATDGIIKLNQDGKVLWSTAIAAHHDLHIDQDGRIYTPVMMPRHAFSAYLGDYRDDGYAILDPDGNIIQQRSFTDILVENDLAHLILGVGPLEPDPLHINAVKPAPTTTPYWQQGDLLVSSRHRSLVFLYRPSTGRITWYRVGPWINQHDPDFLGQHRISVFSNNVVSSPHNRTDTDAALLDNGNQVLVYDFRTNLVSAPYREIMQRIGLSTITGGSHTILSDGSLFVYFNNRGLGALHNRASDSIHWFGARVSDDRVRLGAVPIALDDFPHWDRTGAD